MSFLPPWAQHHTYLTAAQVSLILGFVGGAGQFDAARARSYCQRNGMANVKRVMAKDPTFPRPEYPHGVPGRAYWYADALADWLREKRQATRRSA